MSTPSIRLQCVVLRHSDKFTLLYIAVYSTVSLSSRTASASVNGQEMLFMLYDMAKTYILSLSSISREIN
jgi:hypothetical protein